MRSKARLLLPNQFRWNTDRAHMAIDAEQTNQQKVHVARFQKSPEMLSLGPLKYSIAL
jgi:hypothetical protein